MREIGQFAKLLERWIAVLLRGNWQKVFGKRQTLQLLNLLDQLFVSR